MKKEIQEMQNLLQKLLKNNEELEKELPSVPTDIVMGQASPFVVGQPYLIRTVTHYYTGRVVEVIDKFVQLAEACWIADTGRWAEATKIGSFSEVEPYAYNPWINIDSIVDFGIVSFELPKKQK